MDPGREPRVEPYSPDELTRAVADLADAHPLELHDDSELSIAGLADRMLVVRLRDGGYGRPVRGAPSTHILKVDDRVRRGLVRAEHACLLLARQAGLRAAGSELIAVGDAECIVVERYDRVGGTDQETVRAHQEDACQALAIDPERNDRRGTAAPTSPTSYSSATTITSAATTAPTAPNASPTEASDSPGGHRPKVETCPTCSTTSPTSRRPRRPPTARPRSTRRRG